ncbi:MAG: type II toxin-antitoxin system YoeB family toxin [Hymenobacter sp.]|nr:type II toxin-antitoxin system YoeB family toxin [Hymenobacter sp.]
MHGPQTDKAAPKRLHALPKELPRTPLTGAGRPELPKPEWAGTGSRRITDEHHLEYRVAAGIIRLL